MLDDLAGQAQLHWGETLEALVSESQKLSNFKPSCEQFFPTPQWPFAAAGRQR